LPAFNPQQVLGWSASKKPTSGWEQAFADIVALFICGQLLVQLAEMRDAGVDIEGHTVSHSSLNARKGKTEEQYRAWLKSEIVGSKEMLEKNLGIQIKAFAYPYGLHNQTVRDVVKEAGYEAAFTVWGTANRIRGRSDDETRCRCFCNRTARLGVSATPSFTMICSPSLFVNSLPALFNMLARYHFTVPEKALRRRDN
jgi:hypothetical protein